MDGFSYGSTSTTPDKSVTLTATSLAAKVEVAQLNRHHVVIVLCCFLNHFCVGHLNDAIGLAFDHFDKSWDVADPTRAAVLPVSLMMGIVLSNVITGNLSDRYGRRAVNRILLFGGVLAQVLCVFAPTLWTLCAARILAGFTFGACMITFPALLSEVLPSRHRYLLVAYNFGWPLGGLVFGVLLSWTNWRVASAVGIPTSVILLLLSWLPCGLVESPQFLFANGRKEEALIELCRLTSSSASSIQSDGDIAVESSERQPSPQSTESNASREMWKVRFVLIRTFVSILCQGLASQGFKVWLPTIASTRGSHILAAQFAQMMIVDVVGQALQPVILQHGFADTSGAKPSNAPDPRMLNLARAFSLSAMLSVFGVLSADRPSVYSILGGVHLVAQGSMYNFLTPYAMLCFPVAVRARCMGFVGLAGCIGNALGPLFGSYCLGHFTSKSLGATATIWITGVIYGIGFVSMMGISASGRTCSGHRSNFVKKHADWEALAMEPS